jgi:hypothetical protein
VPSVAFVATEVRDKPKGLSTPRDHALVGPLPGVHADVLRPSPRPLERLGAALPGTLQGPVVKMNSPVLQKVLVHVKMFPTPLPSTEILLVELEVANGVERHDAAFHVTLKLPLQVVTPFVCSFLTTLSLFGFCV